MSPRVVENKGKDVWKWVKLGNRAAAATAGALDNEGPKLPSLQPLNPAPFQPDSAKHETAASSPASEQPSTPLKPASRTSVAPAAPQRSPPLQPSPSPHRAVSTVRAAAARKVKSSSAKISHSSVQSAVAASDEVDHESDQDSNDSKPALKTQMTRTSLQPPTPSDSTTAAASPAVIKAFAVPSASQQPTASSPTSLAVHSHQSQKYIAARVSGAAGEAALSHARHTALRGQGPQTINHSNHTTTGGPPEDSMWLMLRDVGIVGGGIVILMALIFWIVKWKQQRDAEEAVKPKPQIDRRDMGEYEAIKEDPPPDSGMLSSLSLQMQQLHERLQVVEDDGRNTRRRMEEMQIKVDEVYDRVQVRRKGDSDDGSTAGMDGLAGLYSFVQDKDDVKTSRSADLSFQRWSQATDRTEGSERRNSRGRPVRF